MEEPADKQKQAGRERRLLLKFGDYLDALDSVNERNGVGFNKIDKKRWAKVRACSKIFSSEHLRHILRKYKRQLCSVYGEGQWKDAGLDRESSFKWQMPEEPLEITWHKRHRGLEARVAGPFGGYIGGGRFQRYLEICRLHFRGGKDGADFFWMVPWDLFKALDFERLQKECGEIGIKVSPLPDYALKLASETAQKSAAEARAAKKRAVVLSYCPQEDLFSFKFPFHPRLNEFFSNSGGKISGITNFNPANGARETFEADLVEEILEKLASGESPFPVEVGERARQALEEQALRRAKLESPIAGLAPFLAEGIDPYGFQNHGVRFIEMSEGRCLLGDDMGLGKTLQSSAWVALRGLRVLVVCPKVVRRNWCRDAERLLPGYYKGKTREIDAKARKKLEKGMLSLDDKKMVSVNYETFKKIDKKLAGQNFDAIIIDESHRMKNPKAQITQSLQRARESFKYRILLSGTAIKNKKKELYTQVEFIRPGELTRNELAFSTIGGLWSRMRPFYLARQKSRVLKDLPDKTSQIIELEIARMPAMGKLSIGEISRFKEAAAVAKAQASADFVKEILESSDSAVVVFTESLKACKEIHRLLGKKSIIHHGGMGDEARERAKESFQNGSKERVFVTTRQSMAVGATLTRADKVVFSSLPWSAADVSQAEDRCHRIGQKKGVQVFWLQAAGSLWDKKIMELIKSKYELAKKITQGRQVSREERMWMDAPLTLADLAREIKKAKDSNEKNQEQLLA